MYENAMDLMKGNGRGKEASAAPEMVQPGNPFRHGRLLAIFRG